MTRSDQIEYSRAYYLRNKAHINERVRAYYRVNKARIIAKQVQRSRALKYGTSEADVAAMMKEQGGCCAVCGTAIGGKGRRRACVDHCHIAKTVRGLLCPACNVAAGLLYHEPERVELLASYLRDNGAVSTHELKRAATPDQHPQLELFHAHHAENPSPARSTNGSGAEPPAIRAEGQVPLRAVRLDMDEGEGALPQGISAVPVLRAEGTPDACDGGRSHSPAPGKC